MGAHSVKVASIGELESAFKAARAASGVQSIVIDTDSLKTTEAGGFWREVPAPQVSARPEVAAARKAYEDALPHQRLGD